jgi:hypothetical protein
VFIAGGFLAWHGRIFRDTRGTSPVSREWHDLKHPDSDDVAGLGPRDKGRRLDDDDG